MELYKRWQTLSEEFDFIRKVKTLLKSKIFEDARYDTMASRLQPYFDKNETISGTLDSSVLQSFSWEPLTNKLKLVFSGGRTYEYDGVSKEELIRLLSSESKGKQFNVEIKGEKPYKELQ